ncbi:protein of unknown function [Anaerocolumna jejuensis DSM 15929]|uniref:Rv2525c-like glycoside hydrolase-like domain-containing protein n=1 Tax=Anaerocolumna jejuensis DSM 15929 TaxID=1121322 RepID=A0A1M6Q0E7_9FIRM|nr:glycoside hydrolase domain-containing protein [Anaerocolumna jejuensis]SHK13678.1 protein of unknown function [Anaerocolumna jejuensis DSM 15929]
MATIFGVDSAERPTTLVSNGQTLYDWVTSKAGQAPAFWGRYIGGSYAITSDEVTFLHNKNCKILLIYNGATSSSVSSTDGTADGQKAAKAANALNVPSTTAIYADIEQPWKPTSTWIKGFAKTLYNNQFGPGFYANTVTGYFNTPYTTAYKEDTTYVGNHSSLVWPCQPEPGSSTAAGRPTWNPTPPPCLSQSNITFWQYAENCYGTKNKGNTYAISVDLDEARDSAATINLW